MDRKEALDLVKSNLKNINLVKHCLAVEACMKKFAERLGENIHNWSLAGLLHDLDYEYTVNDPTRHTLKTAEMLSSYDLAESIIHAIKSHNKKVDFVSKMDLALYTIDPTTGFITACALMHPSKKLLSIDLKRMRKRFKEKSFAEGADRDQIRQCSELGLELDDFLLTCLKAMQGISIDLGL